jgi:serine/threonine protein kinase
VVVNNLGEALLIDFGSSFDLNDTEPNEICGTYRWMAPESINPGLDEEDENGQERTLAPRLYFATDIWACGMTILEVRTLGNLFSSIGAAY